MKVANRRPYRLFWNTRPSRRPPLQLVFPRLLYGVGCRRKSFTKLAETIEISHTKLAETIEISHNSLASAHNSLTAEVAAYVTDSRERMKQMEVNLDALIRVITAEHSNGKGRV